MKKILTAFLLILVLGYALDKLHAQTAITQTAFPNVFVPLILGLEHDNGASDYLYALSQQGVIYRIDQSNANATAESWLDISDRLVSGGEQGLLGLAFHPDYASNGLFYVNYTAPSPLRTVIAQFEADLETNEALSDSETVLLTFTQPFANHNGGDMAFGPDGYLYIASGDGGSGGDPQNNAQNTQNLLGAMLRIDVNNSGGGLNYAIPPDNPFVGSNEGRDELFAWGLRNPWRISFDKQTGALWAGDVGQNAWEWIHIVENGKNYGWRIIEGSHCYNPPQNCDTTGLEMPIFEYSQSNGDRSITGGFVYYGNQNPALYGKYIYGDFISGRIWALSYDYESGEAGANIELIKLPNNISSFGMDPQGEIYLLTYGNGGILGLLATPPAPVIEQPTQGETVENLHTIIWQGIASVDSWHLQISAFPFFDELLVDEILESNQFEAELYNGTYYARVKATNEAGESSFSAAVQYEVAGTTGIRERMQNREQLRFISIQPNPATDFVRVKFEVSQNLDIQAGLYDMLGNNVRGLVEKILPTGDYEIKFGTKNFAPGLYFIRLKTEYQIISRKIVVLR
jgi:glucose/arabinose dehydrogenase